MSNSKISALTSATTPLAGTEVLPIVQSGATKQVSITNLTAGRAVSAASLALTTALPVTSGGSGTGTAFTAGSVVYAGASGVYSQNNSNFFWDNANIRLGLGTNSPATRLHLSADPGAVIRLENPQTTSTTGLSMGKLEWRTGDASAPGVIASIDVQDYNNFGTAFKMELGGGLVGAVVPALRLDGSANVTVISGNVVIGTSGKGVDFSAVAHSGSTSKLLSDYEEGTFTPTYLPASGAFGAITYNASTAATYTKIGRAVHVVITLRTTSITVGTASGAVYIGGLPFTSASSPVYASLAVSWAAAFGGDYPMGCMVESSATRAALVYRTAVNGTTSFLDVTDLATGTGNYVTVAGTYFV